jgi:hypothetical protein
VRSIRVDGTLLCEEITGDLVRRDPNVIATSQIDLVDGTILLAPVCKLDEAILLWYVGDRSDDGIAYIQEYVSEVL